MTDPTPQDVQRYIADGLSCEHLEVEGDAFAPKLGPEWVRESVEPAEGWSLSKASIRYRIARYRKQ